MAGLHPVRIRILTALSILLCNCLTSHGYGYGTGTSSRPPATQPPPPPPKYQNDREQWGGVGHGSVDNTGDRRGGYQSSSSSGTAAGQRQPYGKEEFGEANFFARRSHIERYGVPDCCVREGDPRNVCNYFVEIAKEEDHPDSLHFEISGHVPPSGGYVRMGLSKDKFMGDDHIVECVLLADGTARVYQSWSPVRNSQPKRLKDNLEIIQTDETYPRYEHEVLTCKFRRPIVTFVDFDGIPMKFDLERGKYHVLLATGNLQFPKSDAIGFHGSAPLETGNVYISPKLLGYNDERYPTATGSRDSWNFNTGSRNHCFRAQTGFVVLLVTFFAGYIIN